MHHLHREKLFSLFDDNQNGVVYLQGAQVMNRYNTDYEFPFRQESNFWYLSGVNEPDCEMLLDLKKEEFHLFVPKRDASYAVWHGYIKSQQSYLDDYKPDHLHYANDLLSVLKELNPDSVYCLNEEQAEFLEDLDRDIKVETETLQDAITYCRLIKTDWELEQMRRACRVNNEAHLALMEAMHPGMYEYEAKAVFESVQMKNGLLQDAYNGIFAAGKNAAILHYVYSSSQVKDGELFLTDAGFEYNGYASDYTRSYPANGKFTPTQAAIYEAVLNALNTCIEDSRPGVEMEKLHLNAARIMMQGLKDEGYIQGDLDEIMDKNIFALFFPHGLGHFLGLDTHDVGGYPKGVERIDRPGIRFLRARRDLQPGMVITIEPGLYFIPALLQPAFEDAEKAPFLNKKKLEGMMDFGGIRIEDNIAITENGHENFTDVPKSIADIEKTMK
jgi:Xaa-Pro dipeptidase